MALASKQHHKVYTFTVIIEKDEDGYFANVPEMQGCYTQGDTYEETIENVKDVIALHIESRLEHNEPVPNSRENMLTVSTVSVKV